jgi:hypothetical protein
MYPHMRFWVWSFVWTSIFSFSSFVLLPVVFPLLILFIYKRKWDIKHGDPKETPNILLSFDWVQKMDLAPSMWTLHGVTQATLERKPWENICVHSFCLERERERKAISHLCRIWDIILASIYRINLVVTIRELIVIYRFFLIKKILKCNFNLHIGHVIIFNFFSN